MFKNWREVKAMARTIRPKQPTMAEQIEALKAEIEMLKAEKEEIYKRARVAEHNVEESRPYKLLKAQYDELSDFVKGLADENASLRERLRMADRHESASRKPKRGRRCKVTDEIRHDVIVLYNNGKGNSMRSIAEEVGVSLGTVSAIVNGK